MFSLFNPPQSPSTIALCLLVQSSVEFYAITQLICFKSSRYVIQTCAFGGGHSCCYKVTHHSGHMTLFGHGQCLSKSKMSLSFNIQHSYLLPMWYLTSCFDHHDDDCLGFLRNSGFFQEQVYLYRDHMTLSLRTCPLHPTNYVTSDTAEQI